MAVQETTETGTRTDQSRLKYAAIAAAGFRDRPGRDLNPRPLECKSSVHTYPSCGGLTFLNGKIGLPLEIVLSNLGKLFILRGRKGGAA
ncbi:MAG: hypothetical protein ABSE15_06295 [Candidatus Bathyarchaeia archaeon]